MTTWQDIGTEGRSVPTVRPRGEGETCSYCLRTLEATTSDSDLSATRDHVVPRSRNRTGPHKTVWACRLCNHIKADRTPEQWDRFMKRNPRWWEHPYFTGKQRPTSGPCNRIPKPPPFEKTMAFLRAAAMRPLRADEPFPIEYDNANAQAAFEGAYAGKKHMLRVPVHQDDVIERMAEAMEQRRAELIAQPLARIWPELAKAAVQIVRPSPPSKEGE